MKHRCEFSVLPGFYLYLSAMLLLLPLKWLFAALLAAAIHEAAHCIALRFLKVPVYSFVLHGSGALLRTACMKPWQEITCAFSGPLSSILLVFLFPIFPRLAICGFLQGLFNLLPAGGLDGARITKIFCNQIFGEKWGGYILNITSCGMLAMMLISVLFLIQNKLYAFAVAAVILLLAIKTKDRFLTNSLRVIN